MATVALSGIITPTNVVTATSTTTLSNKTLVAPALGTPASGVVTNLTGTASININGTVGATTPSTVVATTVQAGTTIGVGGATPSASGAGITFPATQSASTDANTLDDYEEGSWTPVLAATTTNPTVSSYPTRVGRYTKIGRQVTIYCSLQANSSGGSGNMKITGLPFQSTSDDVVATGVSRHNGDFAWGTSKTSIAFGIGSNQTQIDVMAMQNGVTEAGIPIGNFNADSKYVFFNITYYV